MVYCPSRSKIGILPARRTILEKEYNPVNFALLSARSEYHFERHALKSFEGFAFQIPNFIDLDVLDSQSFNKRSKDTLSVLVLQTSGMEVIPDLIQLYPTLQVHAICLF